MLMGAGVAVLLFYNDANSMMLGFGLFGLGALSTLFQSNRPRRRRFSNDIFDTEISKNRIQKSKTSTEIEEKESKPRPRASFWGWN